MLQNRQIRIRTERKKHFSLLTLIPSGLRKTRIQNLNNECECSLSRREESSSHRLFAWLIICPQGKKTSKLLFRQSVIDGGEFEAEVVSVCWEWWHTEESEVFSCSCSKCEESAFSRERAERVLGRALLVLFHPSNSSNIRVSENLIVDPREQNSSMWVRARGCKRRAQ